MTSNGCAYCSEGLVFAYRRDSASLPYVFLCGCGWGSNRTAQFPRMPKWNLDRDKVYIPEKVFQRDKSKEPDWLQKRGGLNEEEKKRTDTARVTMRQL